MGASAKFLRDARGASAGEYVLILALVGAAIAGGATTLGESMAGAYRQAGEMLDDLDFSADPNGGASGGGDLEPPPPPADPGGAGAPAPTAPASAPADHAGAEGAPADPDAGGDAEPNDPENADAGRASREG